jgi:hypothetical protein
LRRLRDRSVRRSAHDRHGDLWDAMRIVFRGCATGEPRLALPALAGIFASHVCAALDAARLENRALLLAVFKLAWLRDDGALARVNWRDMGPEELGSVYESLLELVPQITKDGRQFAFATGGETKGNARKTTGSYYTPDSLVQVLLDNALEPVIADTIAKHPEKPVDALLDLSIVDPACGSGHFLLGAARRLAAHVARLQTSGTPSGPEYRHALRQVVGRCIFGVDLNPMAVELCKVSLWMEAIEPGLPLTFLDSHIQHGNSLIGTTSALMAGGIPDAAFEPIEGDDKKVASALKKRNKAARTSGQTSLEFSRAAEGGTVGLLHAVQALDIASDTDLSGLEGKHAAWKAVLESSAYSAKRLAADTWCAAFVWNKQPGPPADLAPTHDVFLKIQADPSQAPPALAAEVRRLAEVYTFFHWHLAFPQVFAKGGFDVVIGNPPWDSLLFREEEFFADRRPDIAEAATAAKRKKLIAKLESEDAALFAAYRAGLREVDGMNAFVRSGVRFPLCGVGRVNLFALFAEAARSLVSKRGRVGQILPSGIVSDDSTKLFFQDVVEKRQLVSFFDFENREGIFPTVHRSFKFGILTVASERRSGDAEFVFYATRVAHVKEPDRRFTLSPADIALLNPATKTCPIFRSRRDAEITKAIYRRTPILTESGWQLQLRRLLNSADDSGNFLTQPDQGSVPLYEPKYFHQFDHRWASTIDGKECDFTDAEKIDPNRFVAPRYYYPTSDLVERFGSVWDRAWVIAWRRIARSTDERTFIATVLPSTAIPHTARVILPAKERVANAASLLANLGAFVFDYVARQKVGGTDVSSFIVEQLALLAADSFASAAPWDRRERVQDFLTPRVLELTYTAWDLAPFAEDIGYDGPPFRWDSVRRFALRCELDAAFFHLYGLSRNDAAHVMDTFPIVRKNDEKAHGEYRTKRVILGVYDALADAIRSGKPYKTRLDPPPADPRIAHPDRRSAAKRKRSR